MSVVKGIFSGMQGKKEVVPSKLVPSCGHAYRMSGNPSVPLALHPYIKAPKLMPDNIDYSSRRQVLPCKGITHKVLRREAVPSAGALVPPTGIARHEKRGLAYLVEKPINLPIMPMSNPFSSGMNNPLAQPN